METSIGNPSEEVLIKTEIEIFTEPEKFDKEWPRKSGIVYTSRDSSFYINCIVETCKKENFYDIKSFIDHTRIHYNTDGYSVDEYVLTQKDVLPNKSTIDQSTLYDSCKDDKITSKSHYALNEQLGNPLEDSPIEFDAKDRQCQICKKVLSKPAYVKKHMKQHFEKLNEEIFCPICNRHFKYAFLLRLHMQKHKGQSSSMMQSKICENEDSSNSTHSLIQIDENENKKADTENVEVSDKNEDNVEQKEDEIVDIIEIKDEIKANNEEVLSDNVFPKMSPRLSSDSEYDNFKDEFETMNNSLEEEKIKPNQDKKLTRTCHICNKTFQTRKYLRRHIKLHSKVRTVQSIPCPKCDKVFKYEHHLRFHMVKHNSEHRCLECHKVFLDRRGLEKHKLTHGDSKQFQCEQCSARFNQPENLTKHIKRIHEEKVNSCNECNQNFIKRRELYMHNFVIHGIHPPTKFPENKKAAVHKCQICEKIYLSSKSLKRHMMLHNRKSMQPLPCTKCKKTFKYEHHLKAHILSHDNIHKCEECGKVLAKGASLRNHMLYHYGEKNIKCDLCDRWCYSKLQLRRHKASAHAEKKHECQICGMKFRRRYFVKQHMLSHTHERPYVCEICGNSFRTTFLLNEHIKRHNNQRDFKCEYEGCNKTFFSKVALTDHEVTHTKVKSFVCAVEGCNARFTLRSGLVKHKKLHSDKKNYICKICGKAYAQSPGLYAHMKTHDQPLPEIKF